MRAASPAAPTSGNFFVDLQRASFLVLLPVALVVATLMVLGGMPMTFEGAAKAMTLEGVEQTIARGPVAAFVAIKQLGTNGGGFFGPNSTHPFENPTFWTNALSMIVDHPHPDGVRVDVRPRSSAACDMPPIVFRRDAGVPGASRSAVAVYFETAPTQAFAGLPIEQTVGNLEGKELRFGATAGPLGRS